MDCQIRATHSNNQCPFQHDSMKHGNSEDKNENGDKVDLFVCDKVTRKTEVGIFICCVVVLVVVLVVGFVHETKDCVSSRDPHQNIIVFKLSLNQHHPAKGSSVCGGGLGVHDDG